jgi:alpha-tubulin suppressor-like RCC1 family protein
MRELQRPLLASLVLVAGLAACRNDAESPAASSQAEVATDVTANASALVFREVSAGGSHTCGVTTDDRAYCWGDNRGGQLGDGTFARRLRPVAVVGGLRFRQVSAGSDDTCGTTTDNRLYCWGYDFSGEFGQDGCCSTGLNPTPIPLPGTLAWRDVSLPTSALNTSGEHTCAITLDKLAYCWGDNAFGDLGIGPFLGGGDVQSPNQVVGGHHFQQVTTGINHTCGITLTNQAFCWGFNFSGELGIGSRDLLEHNMPLRVKDGGLLFRQVSAGGDYYIDPVENFNTNRGYTCALTTEDTAYCWGDNKFGQLGDNGTHDLTVPHPVAGSHHFGQISAGPLHACAITTQNKAYCWGRNKFGDLGDGTDAFRQRHPVPVVGGLQFSSVSAGDLHTCALTPNGAAYCWGNNQYGQLGIGVTGTRTTPVAVKGP